jgi:hypothetical protein
MERLAADISAARGAAGGLSPHVSPATGVEPASGRISVWLVPVLAALALLAVAVVLNVLVNNLASDAVAAFA